MPALSDMPVRSGHSDAQGIPELFILAGLRQLAELSYGFFLGTITVAAGIAIDL